MLWLCGAALAGELAVVVDGDDLAPAHALITELEQLKVGADIDPADVFAGGWSPESLSEALDAASAAAPVVVALGPASAQAAQQRTPDRKSAVVAAPILWEQPVAPRVYTVPVDVDITAYIDALRRLVPDAPVAIAVPDSLVAGDLPPPEGTQWLLLDDDGTALPEGVGGVVVVSTAPMSDEAAAAQYADWHAQGAVTLGMRADELGRGSVAVLAPEGGPSQLVRRAALLSKELLSDRTPRALGAARLRPGTLTLDLTALIAMGVSPSFDVLGEAELIRSGPAPEPIPIPTLTADALANHPDISALKASIQADDTTIRQAWATWLPQLDVSMTGSTIDPRLASLVQPQHQVSGALTLDQLLYSEGARLNLAIQDALAEGRVAQLESESQDLALEVSEAAINVLRVSALLEVRQNDLRSVTADHAQARARLEAGEIAGSELARWEVEVANARSAVVDAFVQRDLAQQGLALTRGLALDARIMPAPEEAADNPLAAWTDDPRSLQKLTDALVAAGLSMAPELAQLDRSIEAAEKNHQIAVRAWFVPTIAGSVSVNQPFYQSVYDSDLPDEIDEAFAAFFEPPGFYWTAGAQVSLPVFSGGALRADRDSAVSQLASLQHTRQSVERALEVRIRTAATQVQGARLRQELAEQSAAGALRALSAAQDAYARGLANQVT